MITKLSEIREQLDNIEEIISKLNNVEENYEDEYNSNENTLEYHEYKIIDPTAYEVGLNEFAQNNNLDEYEAEDRYKSHVNSMEIEKTAEHFKILDETGYEVGLREFRENLEYEIEGLIEDVSYKGTDGDINERFKSVEEEGYDLGENISTTKPKRVNKKKSMGM